MTTVDAQKRRRPTVRYLDAAEVAATLSQKAASEGFALGLDPDHVPYFSVSCVESDEQGLKEVLQTPLALSENDEELKFLDLRLLALHPGFTEPGFFDRRFFLLVFDLRTDALAVRLGLCADAPGVLLLDLHILVLLPRHQTSPGRVKQWFL